MTEERRSERLGRGERLARRVDFLAAQERGRRISGTSYLLFALPRGPERPGAQARLGVTVSKKVGKAVVRNRVKRWVRESYRRASDLAPARTDLVVVARPGAASRGYEATAEELTGLLRRLAR